MGVIGLNMLVTGVDVTREHLIMYLGKETSTLGITGLTFLRIASPRVGKVPPCRLHGNVSIERS